MSVTMTSACNIPRVQAKVIARLCGNRASLCEEKRKVDAQHVDRKHFKKSPIGVEGSLIDAVDGAVIVLKA